MLKYFIFVNRSRTWIAKLLLGFNKIPSHPKMIKLSCSVSNDS